MITKLDNGILRYSLGDAPLAAQTAVEKLTPLFNELGAPCWIAGGCVRDLCLYGHHNTDIDVFFKTTEDCNKAYHEMMGYKRTDIQDDNSTGATHTESSELILKNERVFKFSVPGLGKIDIVRVLGKSPGDTIANFDFTVCAAAVDRAGNFYCHSRFFEDLVNRKLVIVKLPAPMSTMRRLQKYTQKGYTICQGGLLEIGKAVQNIDLSQQQVYYVD